MYRLDKQALIYKTENLQAQILNAANLIASEASFDFADKDYEEIDIRDHAGELLTKIIRYDHGGEIRIAYNKGEYAYAEIPIADELKMRFRPEYWLLIYKDQFFYADFLRNVCDLVLNKKLPDNIYVFQACLNLFLATEGLSSLKVDGVCGGETKGAAQLFYDKISSLLGGF